MRHMPQMVAVMTPFPHHIDALAPLADALAMMDEHDIRHLPVFEKGDVVGVISERDLERAHIPGHLLREETDLMVGDLCRRRPLFVDIGDPLDRVLTAMVDKRLDSVLVLKEGELAGVFTATDACHLLALLLLEQYGPIPPGTDAA